MLFLGLDPGLNGAFSVYDSAVHKLVRVQSFATRKDLTSGKTKLDLQTIAVELEPYKGHVKMALVEQVSSAPKQGVVSVFTFGEGFGALQGILAAFRIPARFVRPSVWKADLGLSSDKRASLNLATKRFPYMAAEFKQTKDDGKAESALLAWYAGRNHNAAAPVETLADIL